MSGVTAKDDPSDNAKPAWLSRMENGTIGEARTRSFLIDRFWILERSVDIEGADFIIQRRITGRTLLDKDPPRLGFAQVKFFGSPSTTHYIHREYVVSPDDRPRDEFFLMCHMGRESDAVAYILSAQDIVAELSVTGPSHSHPDCYALSGKTLADSDRYKVVSEQLSLDRIERALREADFATNRRFMSWALPYMDEDLDSIDPIYEEPLDNHYADIPEQFKKLKKGARRALMDIEEFGELVAKIANAIDPETALSDAEYLESYYGSSVRVRDQLYDEDLLNVVRDHKTRYETLRAAGLLDKYLALQSECTREICSYLAPKMPLDSEDVYIVDVTYEKANLAPWSIMSRIAAFEEVTFPEKDGSSLFASPTEGRLSCAPGAIRGYCIPSRRGYSEYRNGRWENDPKKPWEEKLLTPALVLTREILDAVYAQRFPDSDCMVCEFFKAD
ncbi:hypothetical protein ACFLSJ_05800 [Verrucomicrobiota bacterium]